MSFRINISCGLSLNRIIQVLYTFQQIFVFVVELKFVFSQIKDKMVNKSINQFIFLVNNIGLKFQFHVKWSHNAFRVQDLNAIW